MMSLWRRIDDWDRRIICAVVKLRKNNLVALLKVMTESARGYAWALYVCVLYFLNALDLNVLPEQGLLLRAMFAPFLTWLLCNLIKRAVNRKRPYQHLVHFKALTHSPLNDSFPSLHAGSTFAFSIFLFLNGSIYAPFTLLWAIIVSFSRFYLGVHYLTDLIAGALLGGGCAVVVHLLLSAKGLFT